MAKRTAFFLIPTTYASDGKLPLDYQFVEQEVDRRTRFWKVNKTRETSAELVVSVAERYGLRVFWDDGRLCRILAPNGKAAKAFCGRMAALGWRDKDHD